MVAVVVGGDTARTDRVGDTRPWADVCGGGGNASGQFGNGGGGGGGRRDGLVGDRCGSRGAGGVVREGEGLGPWCPW